MTNLTFEYLHSTIKYRVKRCANNIRLLYEDGGYTSSKCADTHSFICELEKGKLT